MSLLRNASAIFGLLAAGQAVLSCGGTTRSGGTGAAGTGATGSAAAGQGATGSTAAGQGATGSAAAGQGAAASAGETAAGGSMTLLPAPECAPLDARSSGQECGGVAGYTWRGRMCEAVLCSCRGADCDRIYPTMAACDSAHSACYDLAGIRRSCTSHADCGFQSRTCCAVCSTPQADNLLAVHTDSATLVETGSCLNPMDACPKCAALPSPTLYPACIDGTCSLLDVTPEAGCETPADCRLVSKDCCDCGGDFTSNGVMAVGMEYTTPARCAGVGCDGCLPAPPQGIELECDIERRVCALLVTTP